MFPPRDPRDNGILASLRCEIDELHEEIRQLKEHMLPASLPFADFRLSPQEARLLARLVYANGEWVNMQNLIYAMELPNDGQGTPDHVRQVVTHIRQKLERASVEVVISNSWGGNYRLRREDCEKLKGMGN